MVIKLKTETGNGTDAPGNSDITKGELIINSQIGKLWFGNDSSDTFSIAGQRWDLDPKILKIMTFTTSDDTGSVGILTEDPQNILHVFSEIEPISDWGPYTTGITIGPSSSVGHNETYGLFLGNGTQYGYQPTVIGHSYDSTDNGLCLIGNISASGEATTTAGIYLSGRRTESGSAGVGAPMLDTQFVMNLTNYTQSLMKVQGGGTVIFPESASWQNSNNRILIGTGSVTSASFLPGYSRAHIHEKSTGITRDVINLK